MYKVRSETLKKYLTNKSENNTNIILESNMIYVLLLQLRYNSCLRFSCYFNGQNYVQCDVVTLK